MTLREALEAAARDLTAAGIEGGARDARLLMAHALGVSPGRITLMLQDPMEPDAQPIYRRALRRRAAREPLSHILGGRWFFDHWFQVTADVLDPRPETETLVLAALDTPFDSVLDLGTGTGCILLSLLKARPGARGLGTDLSERALEVARRNAASLELTDRVTLHPGDWFDGVTGLFDLIVSNPPYIRADEMPGLSPEVRDHEPRMALTDEADGLDAYRRIAAGVRAHLAPGGRVLVEIGVGQERDVGDLFSRAGLADIRFHDDMDGRARVVGAKQPPE